MTALKLQAFGGMMPSWDARLLPDGQSDYALNCYLFGGTLIGWRQPKLLHTLSSAAKYVYRVVNKDTNDTAITATDGKWLEFPDPDTTVMRSPVVQDKYDRHYVASPSSKPRYNTYDRIMAGEPWWLLGVPASGCAPGVTVDGGGDSAQLGNPAGGGGTDWRSGNSIFLVPINPEAAMLQTSVSFMPASTDPDLHYQAVIYSDLNGAPYQLLGTGAEMTGVTAGTQAASVFVNSVSVDGHVPYWIGISTDASMDVTTGGASGGVFVNNTYENGPPTSMSPAAAGASWQMWADMVGASVFTARAYVYTWVTEYGEEGPPSEPSVVNGWSNATWTIELFTPPASDMGVDRNITHTRIYRTITNLSGLATYFFVAEIPVAQGEYVDTIDDATVALNSQLVSLYWFPPPEDLQCLVPFPNGITVGFRKNEVWFSEAYRPHAWPPGYVITTEFPIVGIGVCGQAIVVCTKSSPYVVNGINPSAMALTKVNLAEPCAHRGSIVSLDTNVLYVSQNGLIQVSQSGAGSNITESWVSRERWRELTPVTVVRSVKLATSYFAFGAFSGSAIRDGYTVELTQQDQTSFTIWPQPGGHRIGFGLLSSPNDFDIDNVLLDPWTGVCLLVQNGAVYYYDFADPSPTIVPYKWRSKVHQMQSRKNFQAMRVFFSVPATTPPQAARNVNEPQPTLAANQYGIIRAYTDGKLFTTRELRTNGELLRLYSGSVAEQWQLEIEGRVNVSNLQIATSVKELGLI